MSENLMSAKFRGHDDILRNLKAMMKGGFSKVDHQDYVNYLREESDRGAIILAATLVDDALQEALKRHLTGLNSDEKTRIFDYNGPLGSFSSRIIMAQGLGFFTRTTRKQIDIIREMRNVAAHAHLLVNFDAPIIKEAFASIFDKVDGARADVESWDREKTRSAYLMMCGINADYIIEHDKVKDRKMEHLLRMLRVTHFSNNLK